MGSYGRPDDDLVPKGEPASQTRKNTQKTAYPDEAPPPIWDPLHVENELYGRPQLPPHLTNASPIELFQLFWPNNVISQLVAYTNENARLRPQPEAQYARSWHAVTPSEIYGYFAIVIHMGIHPERRVRDFWRSDVHFGVHHVVTGEIMSRIRFEQIDRYIYLCPPLRDNEQPFTSTFERVFTLSNHIRRISQSYWLPSLNLAVDESMIRFHGRAKETTTIGCKAAGTGFKTWLLGDAGYCLNWRFHTRGPKPTDGPYKLRLDWRKAGFSATHSVVLDMVLDLKLSDVTQRLLPPNKHVIWLDNLFTTLPLLERLRMDGVGAAGTVRTGRTPREITEEKRTKIESQPSSQPLGLLPTPPASQQASKSKLPKELTYTIPSEHFSDELVKCKPWREQLPWGFIRYDVSRTRKVGMFAWRDNSVVLFATTVGSLSQTVIKSRRRPAQSRSGASQTRKLFGSDIRKDLPIPKLIDDYNHYMGGVDRFDQLRSYYSILRPHFKTWRPLFALLFEISLVNSYKLAPANQRTVTDAHRRWLLTLVVQLKGLAFQKIRRQRSPPRPPRLQHELVRLYPKQRSCAACLDRGQRSTPARKPLADITKSSTNRVQKPRPRRTYWGCLQCKTPLCSSSQRPCWSEHVNTAQSSYFHLQRPR